MNKKTISCSYCGSENATSIDSYKHMWHLCNDCGTTVREGKEKLSLDNFLTRAIIRNTKLNKIYGETLLFHPEIDSNNGFYTYYKEQAKKGVKGTKWENQIEEIFASFQEYGITLKDKRVLDISGGPGFLSKTMEQQGAEVVLTEFAQEAADGIKDALNLDARKFDYNTDRIHKVVDGKFDLIICMYSISYCGNIKSFVKDLKEISHPDTLIYLIYPVPSLGLFLRGQFEEYTYSTLHNEKTTQEAFAKEGFEMLHESKAPGYHYTTDWFQPGKKKIVSMLQGVHRKIANRYHKKAEKKLTDISLIQRGVTQVFKA